MNSFQTVNTQTKLEQLRHDAQLHNLIAPIRQQHLNKLVSAIGTLLAEIRALSFGSLEIAGNTQVQKHV
jgi:hypothetical protein